MITEWIDSFLEVTVNGELSKGVRTVSTALSWCLVVPLLSTVTFWSSTSGKPPLWQAARSSLGTGCSSLSGCRELHNCIGRGVGSCQLSLARQKDEERHHGVRKEGGCRGASPRGLSVTKALNPEQAARGHAADHLSANVRDLQWESLPSSPCCLASRSKVCPSPGLRADWVEGPDASI